MQQREGALALRHVSLHASPPPPAAAAAAPQRTPRSSVSRSCAECPILQQVACERGAGHCLRAPGSPAPRSDWALCDRILAACRTHNAPGAAPPPVTAKQLSGGSAGLARGGGSGGSVEECAAELVLEPLQAAVQAAPRRSVAGGGGGGGGAGWSLSDISARLRSRQYTRCARALPAPAAASACVACVRVRAVRRADALRGCMVTHRRTEELAHDMRELFAAAAAEGGAAAAWAASVSLDFEALWCVRGGAAAATHRAPARAQAAPPQRCAATHPTKPSLCVADDASCAPPPPQVSRHVRRRRRVGRHGGRHGAALRHAGGTARPVAAAAPELELTRRRRFAGPEQVPTPCRQAPSAGVPRAAARRAARAARAAA
jgi:hypothetical protein